MKTELKAKKAGFFERFSRSVTRAVGSTAAFFIALGIVAGWALSGPMFGFSETWQLFINTGTTIITFLVVFLIQKSQNKDSMAIQLKLNELIAASESASNRLVNIENITEAELDAISEYYVRLSELVKNEETLLESHSIDEAAKKHRQKGDLRRKTKSNTGGVKF